MADPKNVRRADRRRYCWRPERDRIRDAHLKQHYWVSVLRIRGKDIWRNNDSITRIVEVVQAWLL